MATSETVHSAETAVVPFRIRVGITGHRHLDDEAGVATAVREVLRAIERLVPSSERTPSRITIISSLAEGADRVGARVGAELPDARLEAPLPFPRDDYLADFETAASKEEFLRLLNTADVAPTRRSDRDEGLEEDRDEGYVAVGKYVSLRSDVVIAVWDGEPSRGRGGTAEIVERAITNEVPVFWVPASSPSDWSVLTTPPEGDRGGLTFENPPSSTSPETSPEMRACIHRLHEEWRMVDLYNEEATRRGHVRFDDDEPLPTELRWAAAAVAAADALAIKYQRRYRGSLRWTFRLAALAVIAIAAAKIFELSLWVNAFDAACILALVVVVWWSRNDLQHERYLGYRFLAERLREAPFLAQAVIEQVQPTAFAPEFAGYPSEGWPWRVFDEIWSARPRCSLAKMDVAVVSSQLAEFWISSQLAFHNKSYDDARAKQRRLEQWVKWLFVVTGATAVIHIGLEAGPWHFDNEPYNLPNAMVFVSISAGAIGAALAGFGSQRGYRRDKARARQMQIFLRDDLERMVAAKHPTAVRRVAEDTHQHMFAESRTWFGDLLFEEIEVHT